MKYKDEGAGLDDVSEDRGAELTDILKDETATETQGTGDTGGRGAGRT